ncbi:MAG: serine/threonine-protein kinase, partial [Chloroflexota bacterium]
MSDRTAPPVHDATTVRLDTLADRLGERASPERLLLGRYRLGPVIGQGGMAIVHRGEDTRTGRPVAIKLLAPHLSADPQFRRRMLAEARAAARLPHPHIVQTLDAGEAPSTGEPDAASAGGAVVVVMELVAGEALDARIAHGPLPIAAAVEIAAEVAEALAFAHGRGIVHRDVKPHNILLTDPPAVPRVGRLVAGRPRVWAKLADFGIARSLNAATSYTATGQVMGSAPYIAPEVLEGRSGDARADVYALGATLYQALTGRQPFEAESQAAALALRLVQDAPRVRHSRPDAPPRLDDLVAQSLARDPAARIQDAQSLALALHTLNGATTRVLTTAAPPAPSSHRTSRPPPDETGAIAGVPYAGPAQAPPLR